MRLSLLSSLLLVVTASACLVSPSNGFDPDAPPEVQIPARVDVTVKDTGGDVLSAGVSVSVEGAAGNVDAVLDDGVFVAKDVPPGAVTVVVTSAGAGTATRDIVLVAGETRAVTVVVAADASQLGTVTGIARKQGQLTETVADHSGVVVEAFVAAVSTGVRGVTNAQGRFDLQLAAGTYEVAFSATDHEPTERPGIVVTAGETLTLEPVTLEVNPGSIDGTVVLEDLDNDGDPPSPAGATVALVGTSTTATVGADGSFRITDLPPGNRTLQVSFDDHVSVDVAVVVRAGSTQEIAPVTLLHNRGVVTGVVEVAGGADDSGVLVEADGSGVIDVTGVDGAFTLRVPTGTWNVIASRAGSRRAREDAVVVGTDANVDVGVLTLTPNVGALVINDGSGLTNDRDVVLVLDEPGAARVRASEDPAFGSGVVDVEYPADGRVAFTVGTGDGTKTIIVQVIETGGDVKTLTGSIVVDTTPPELDDLVINGDPDVEFTTDVSITVEVSGTGADEMAIATDGRIDSELFTPFAAAAIAVLSPIDGPTDICAMLRDRAGNTAGPLCRPLILETVVPVSPRFRINGRLADTVVVTSAIAEVFHVEVIPFGGPANSDVVALEGTIEAEDIVLGGVGDDVDYGCAADDDGLIVCDDDDGIDGIFVPLFLDTQAGEEVRPNLLTLRARDAAGNLSADSALVVVVDDRAPLAPTPSNASCVTPIVGGCLDDLYAADINVNSDSFTLKLDEQPSEIDKTFARYEVARTVGDDVTPREFVPTASVDNIVFALTQGAPLNGADVTPTCNPLRCENHLFLRAVDLAGNKGALVRIDVVEDSSPPTRPVLAPRGGIQRGTVAEIRLTAPAVDRSGGGAGEPVLAYEIKEGVDGAFEGVPDQQPVQGPWSLGVLPNDVSEVCVRGVDEAGNVGIEDCVVVEENTRTYPVHTELADRRVELAGDLMIAVIERNIVVHDLTDDDLTDGVAAQNNDLAEIGNPGLLHSAHRYSSSLGREVVDVVVDAEGSGPTTGFFFFPDVRPGTAQNFRAICGRGADTDGVNVVFERGGRLFQVSRTIAAALTPNASENAACVNIGTDLGPLPNLCPSTSVQVEGGNIVWCENTRTIKRRDVGGVVTTLTTNGAASNGGIFSGNNDPQQPLISTTQAFFAEAIGAGPATIRRVPNGTNTAIDTGVRVNLLGDADGDRVAFLAFAPDGPGAGVAIDVAFVDLAVSTAAEFLTNDLAPQSQVVVDGSRVGFIDLASLTEDAAVVERTGQRWLAATRASETQTAVGDGIVVWISFDNELTVNARVDVVGGTREVELARVNVGNLANSPLSFVGGTPLGPNTLGAGGASVFLFKNNGASWEANVVSADDVDPAITPIPGALRPVDATNDASTTAWGASSDGTALVTVTSAGQLRLTRLAGSTVVDTDALLANVGANVVPFVDVDVNGAGGVTVAQVGNVNPGGGGDERRAFVGALTCFAHDANGGVLRSGVVQRGGVNLVARAPNVAIVGNKTFLAYQDVTAGHAHTRVCDLSCASLPPTCTNDVALGVDDDGAPVVSNTGLVVWVTAARSGFGDVGLFDAVKTHATLLTGAGGDTSPRNFADVNGDHVVWSDARLGNFDLWESVVVH